MWLKQNRNRITGGFGLALIVMAMAIPVLAPADERGDVLIMTLLFSLVGAGMIYVAMSDPAMTRGKGLPQREPSQSERAGLMRRRDHRSRNVAGLAFACFITMSGAAAPFLFPGVGPDERFAMMIGFAPVAIAGAVLGYVFLQALRPHGSEPPRITPAAPDPISRKPPAADRSPAARSPVGRVPGTALYDKVVPATIVALMIAVAAIVAFLVIVVAATVLPLL